MSISEDRDRKAQEHRLRLLEKTGWMVALTNQGKSNTEIARMLHISENYVRAVLEFKKATDIPRITSVSFLESMSRYGNKEALAVMEDNTKEVIFAWFDDELTFTREELVGLTIEEARDLKQARDKQYLMS